MKAITFPAVGIPEETYLTDAGGNNESPIYGYVRRGEFLDLEELGDETVDPWHDQGHVALVTTDTDMGASDTAIHSAKDLFWQWHKRVDDVRATFSTDMAKINSTTPADLQTITAPLTTFIVTFKLPVSCKPKSSEPAKNGAQIKAEFLTLNGIKATDVHVSADYKTLTFDVTMPISGAVRAVFTGTRSVAAFDVTFTVQP